MSIFQKRLSAHRSHRAFGAGLVVTALAAVSLPLAATSASALLDPNTPPATGAITVFSARDGVLAEGFASGTIEVQRAGVTIGTSGPLTRNAIDNNITVNDPTAAVLNPWLGVTPDIRPGDVVRVITSRVGNPLDGDQTTTAGVTVTQPAKAVNATTVTVKGTAVGIPLAQLEATITAPKVGAKFAAGNALIATKDGSLTMDVLGNWTATFAGLSPDDVALALRSTSDVAWIGRVVPAAGALLPEQTIVTFGETAGPAGGGPFAVGPTAPTMTPATNGGLKTDNLTNNARPTFVGRTSLTSATSVNLYEGTTRIGSGLVANGSFSVAPTTALATGTHVITVGEVGPNAAAAVAGTTAETMGLSSASVIIDTLAPRMVRHSLGGTRVVQAANLTATFGENVTGLSRATFTLRKTFSRVSAGATVVSYNPTKKTATLNPKASLAPSTRYTASLTSGIKDVAGNPLRATTWTFETGPRATVTARGPVGTNVNRASNIRAAFSEKVAGVSRATFTLRKTTTGRSVGATVVSYNAATRVATLNPRATLAPRTRYTATLTSGIRDADGNRMITKSWTFVTGR